MPSQASCVSTFSRIFVLSVSLVSIACVADAPVASKSKKTKPSASAEPTGGDEDPPAAAPPSNTPPAPPANPDPKPTTGGSDPTNGTGGPTGANTLESTGGLSYMIDAQTGAGPHGLLVLLHGSGASNYTTFVGMMASVAQDNDLIRVSVLAPNGQGWNEGDQVAAAKLLDQLVQQDLFPKYNIDKNKVLFSGQSSGGGFLSTDFIPLYGKNYKGGAFLQCGAAPPAVAFMPDAAMKQTFRLHFEITSGDPIWPQYYAQAVDAYTAAGMTLTKDNTKPGGHCAFDQQQVIKDHIAFVLGGANPK